MLKYLLSLRFHNLHGVSSPDLLRSFYAKNWRLKKSWLCMSLECMQSRANPAASIIGGIFIITINFTTYGNWCSILDWSSIVLQLSVNSIEEPVTTFVGGVASCRKIHAEGL